MAAGPAARVTPSTSRGPGARTARRALPCRYGRSATRHGREPGDRRAAQRLAGARPGGCRPGSRACGRGVLPARRAGRRPCRRDRRAPDRSRRSRPQGPRAVLRPGCLPRPGCAWTDLDPARRPLAQAQAGGPALLLQAGCPEAGQAALVITGRGGPGSSVLYAACERVLRPGGVLAVITASTPRPAGRVVVITVLSPHGQPYDDHGGQPDPVSYPSLPAILDVHSCDNHPDLTTDDGLYAARQMTQAGRGSSACRPLLAHLQAPRRPSLQRLLH